MLQPETSLKFVVRRREPELISPAAPTPRELKPLSDLDDQQGVRCQLLGIQLYRMDPKMGDKDPASVIRDALAKVLVFYYPFAGRLKEGPTKKLMVDCTGEGVLFIEAEADVTLKQFGKRLHPPFPCMEELLYDVPNSSGIVGSPLLLVTRLLCGGFIFAHRINHSMGDGVGIIQFLTALGEMAQGASKPSILPVWQRELLFAREPPHVSFPHHEYDVVEETNINNVRTEDLIQKSFFFGPNKVSALRRLVPENLKSCSTFEVIAACLWRCRTIALQIDPKEEMRFFFPFSIRTKLNPPLPIGYYGNSFILPCVISTAGDLSKKPLSHALELVIKAKSLVSEEYVRSTIDLLVIRGRPLVTIHHSFIVSNLTRMGFSDIDFGWGKAVYGGPATVGIDIVPGVFNFYISSTNDKGESGIVVPIYLPKAKVAIFVNELNNMLILFNKTFYVCYDLCGGFIFASRINHTMIDGVGVIQFMRPLGEMARGASTSSELPVWQRKLLSAREPPHVTFPHHEYDVVEEANVINIATEELIEKSLFFGPSEVSALRRLVPKNLKSCSTFEVIASCLWRCRTIALQLDPKEEMCFLFPFNVHAKFNPPLPTGYYGNTFILPCVISTAGDLSTKPLSHALELVMKAKSLVSEEYVRSTIDLLVIKGRHSVTLHHSYIVSNLTRLRYSEIDLWGGGGGGGGSSLWRSCYSWIRYHPWSLQLLCSTYILQTTKVNQEL
ncbi:hypothetical protein OSB04_013721 [Centaurea solstitialis]|uniref:Benzyl alcohol O-benzoyltransferase n=1 Tax=Centaurea solstitialis TaxID=347529 RepID=A0AA38TWV1_9ASTR|nr:hypothetical protein OSB04_013721 [Centaurea solstitialis]